MKNRTQVRRLILLNEANRPIVKIDYQINGFDEFVRWMKFRRPDLWEQNSEQTVFHKFAVQKIVVIGCAIFFLAMGATINKVPYFLTGWARRRI